MSITYAICWNGFDANDEWTEHDEDAVGYSIYPRVEAQHAALELDDYHEVETLAAAEAIVIQLAAKYQTNDIRRF